MAGQSITITNLVQPPRKRHQKSDPHQLILVRIAKVNQALTEVNFGLVSGASQARITVPSNKTTPQTNIVTYGPPQTGSS